MAGSPLAPSENVRPKSPLLNYDLLGALQLSGWAGLYVAVIFFAGVSFYQAGPKRLPRVVYTVGGGCVGFAVGQAAGFHIGTQAEEWLVVNALLVAVCGVAGAIAKMRGWL